jgi:hypothetical protein
MHPLPLLNVDEVVKGAECIADIADEVVKARWWRNERDATLDFGFLSFSLCAFQVCAFANQGVGCEWTVKCREEGVKGWKGRHEAKGLSFCSEREACRDKIRDGVKR